jgi:outer membrane protein TolC
MAAGGAAVAAAVQAQNSERRELIASGYERRIELARARLANAQALLTTVQRDVAVGVQPRIRAEEARLDVRDSEREVQIVELQLQEVRLTSREPVDDISAPLVSGRDFVTERLQASLLTPEQGLTVARTTAQAMQRRMEVGLATVTDLAEADARVLELQAAVASIQRKLQIRRQFVAGLITAAQADLRVIESEAEQRVKALEPRIALARKHVADAERRFQVGVANHVDLAEAKLRLSTLEADLAKAQLDLALIRKKINEPG